MNSGSGDAITGKLVDTAQSLTFTFEGRPITASAGQTLGAALHAAGVRMLSRSFKYHRPRGLYCAAGECGSCLVRVDGRPNVRACQEVVRGGEEVQAQHAWPGLGFDLLRLVDKLDWLFPVGFYYRRFHKPRWAWPFFERWLRRAAGLGRVDLEAPTTNDATCENLQAELCVIGAGPAGWSAAHAAATAGADVLVLESMPRIGGRLLFDDGARPAQEEFAALPTSLPRIRLLTETTAFGIYEGNLIGAMQQGRFLRIRARQILVCTGDRQQPFVFHNNDLPGIMLGRAAQRLLQLYGVRPGERAVVLTHHADGRSLARQLLAAGVRVAALIDQRLDADQAPLGDALVLRGATITSAVGNKRLKAVRVCKLNPDGSLDLTSRQEIACDLLCLVSAPVPATELLRQAGVQFQVDEAGWRITQPVPGIAAAGGAAGTQDVAAQLQEGHMRGLEAAAALGYQTATIPSLPVGAVPAARATLFNPAFVPAERKRFLCLCEDVTEKDCQQAVAEGFDHPETLKRYTSVGMGVCQGRACSEITRTVCAQLTSRPGGEVKPTTARPPAVPVELGLLAASSLHPVRRTPLHALHQNAGARWLDAGGWQRPESYGDVKAEVRAVREGVGIIDVSTLGKLEIVGPDAGEFLDRIYVNRWSNLAVGKARYGVLCTEDGIIFDDGVGARLAQEQFYLTTTSGNAEAVYQWLELWRTAWKLKVTIVPHTVGVAAINVAGPRARDLLGKVIRWDASAVEFPYMTARDAEVAGVLCRLLRVGFVGEVGYEIHCPSAYAWHVWKSLTEQGMLMNLKPFGVEAQRILRLEKGHILIGQDTDTLSTPLDAGLEKLVDFNKPLFLGREPLQRRAARGLRTRLIGFNLESEALLPEEGCQVVEQGRSVGRVTSIRYSPTLQRTIGLAWVPTEKAAVGSRFTIRAGGADITAVVAERPFYDPRGERQRS